MYDEIVNKILEFIDEKLISTEIYPKFSGEDYKSIKIDLKNFHEIKKSNSAKKIAFIDGGNAEIIGSANFLLNFVRIGYVVYENNKKVAFYKCDFFAFVNTINKNGEINYKASFFGLKNPNFLEELSFSSLDHTLMHGVNRAEISSIANAIRRFAELRIAKNISERDNFCDIIVLDGNLQSTLTSENKYLNELYESCSKNNVILSALSKKTSLFTENGNLLSVVLDNLSTFKSWFYHPIVEINNTNHKAEMFFVKLHYDSKHIFRFEIFNEQRAKAEETINALVSNCVDPIFIGYPYGLIDADKIARVTNYEKESLKIMFLMKLKNKNIEKYLSSLNAHEILDKISF